MTLVSSEPQTPGGKVPGRRGAECARARCSHIALLPLLREGDLTSQPKPRALWPSKTTGQAGWISMLGTRRECYRNSTPHRSPKSQGQFTYFHALIAPALQKYILKKLKQVTSLAQSTHRATQTLGQGGVCRRRALCGEQPRAHPFHVLMTPARSSKALCPTGLCHAFTSVLWTSIGASGCLT